MMCVSLAVKSTWKGGDVDGGAVVLTINILDFYACFFFPGCELETSLFVRLFGSLIPTDSFSSSVHVLIYIFFYIFLFPQLYVATAGLVYIFSSLLFSFQARVIWLVPVTYYQGPPLRFLSLEFVFLLLPRAARACLCASELDSCFGFLFDMPF